MTAPMEKWMRYLDSAGRVAVWPARRDARAAVLRYLGAGLDFGRYYTEKEVSRLLDGWHTFGDYFLLRRELVDSGILNRVADGSRYWRGDILTGPVSWGPATLRRVTPADREAIRAVQRQCADYRGYAGRDFTQKDADDLIGGALPPGGLPEFFHAWLCLTPSGEPAGYLAYYLGYPDGRCLYIASLFLAKPYRRQGIGAAVVGGLAGLAARAGISTLRAGVMTENIPGLSFWIRQGFARISGIRPYKDTGKYALGLFRPLPDAESGPAPIQEDVK